MVTAAYHLRSDEVGEALAKSLSDGEIFEMPYNYRDGYERDVLFVLENDHGIFGLVGRPTQFVPIARDLPEPALLDEDDEDDALADDFDFSVM